MFAYFTMAVLGAVSVEPVSSGEFELPAPRPRNSALGNIRLRRDGLPLMRPWQAAVDEYVQGFPET
jgi:dTDP-4-dehydrorhamnose reductase